MTTGKTIALTMWTVVGKVVSLLFNMLSRVIIAYFPIRKHLLISWLQSLSAVILEPKKIKSDTVSTVSPSISQEVMGPDSNNYSAIKRIEIGSFVEMWMDLEFVRVKDVRKQKTNIIY